MNQLSSQSEKLLKQHCFISSITLTTAIVLKSVIPTIEWKVSFEGFHDVVDDVSHSNKDKTLKETWWTAKLPGHHEKKWWIHTKNLLSKGWATMYLTFLPFRTQICVIFSTDGGNFTDFSSKKEKKYNSKQFQIKILEEYLLIHRQLIRYYLYPQWSINCSVWNRQQMLLIRRLHIKT